MKTAKHLVALALALVMTLSLVACGGNNSSDGGKKDGSTRTDVNLYIADNVPSFDPAEVSSIVQTYVLAQMYNCLTAMEEDGSIVCELAESYDIGEDGLTYTFHLRKDVKFHNGDTLKASDVVYSMKRDMESAYVGSYTAGIVDVTAPDDSTVVFTLSAINASFLENLASLYIVSEAAVEAAGDNYNSAPVGTGAYKFVSYTTSDRLVLERFDEYYLGAADIKDVTFRVIPDATTATISIQTGDVDFGVISTDSYSNVAADENLTLYSYDIPATYMAMVNTEAAPFNDIRVRQALSYAIDREFILESVGGFGTVASSVVNPVAMHGTDGLRNNYTYDPDKATALLKEAGCTNLNLTIKISAGLETMAAVLQQNLKDVGITATVETLEKNALTAETADGNYDITLMVLSLSAPADFALLLTPDYIGSLNFPRYNNAAVNNLFAKAAVTLDDTQRRSTYVELFNTVADDAPYMPLYWPQGYAAHDKDLQVDNYYYGYPEVFTMHWN